MSYALNNQLAGLIRVDNQTVSVNTDVLSFTGLDGDVDVQYVLFFHFINNAGAQANYRFLPNDTAGNLSAILFCNTGGTIVASSAANTNEFAFASGNAGFTSCDGILSFYARTGARRRFQSSITGASVTDEAITSYTNRWDDSATNVTTIFIRSTMANGIGVGSQFNLFKVRQD